jgi:hypothetical protein
MKSTTETLIVAMRALADHIYSEDGVANAAIAEAADRLEELKRENAALKKSILNAEVLAEYDPAHEHKDWWSGGCWLRSGQQLVIIDRAAIDTAMKEDTNVSTK